MLKGGPPEVMPGAATAAAASCEGQDFIYSFRAMATPCEIRIEADNDDRAAAAAKIAEGEARRIEQKFSRYRADSIVGRINGSMGEAIEVDNETADLLDFAAHCYKISDGVFDITSGALRRIWRFDGSANIPADDEIAEILPFIGWHRVKWRRPVIALCAGMEIDLGGIGKEFGVDSAMRLLRAACNNPTLVNFGGDLCVSGPRRSGAPWKVAIESVDRQEGMAGLIELSSGAIATSGDARRFLLKDGVRHSHILNARTGRSIADAPRSVTVAAPTCVEAGTMATLAMLQGRKAEAFLKREKVKAWCIR